MILQKLYDYYQANRVTKDENGIPLFPKYGYSSQKVSFRLSLKGNGKLDSIDLCNKSLFLPDLGAIDVQKTSGIVSAYYVGTVSYVFGSLLDKSGLRPYPKDDSKKSIRLRKSLDSFINLHEEIYQQTKNQYLKSLLRFLSSIKNREFDFETVRPTLESAKTGGLVEICVQGHPLHEEKDLIKFWDATVKNHKPFTGVCMVTGERETLRNIHGKIKVPGTSAAGGTLVSFNKAAHISYQKENFPIVPISCKVEFGYRTVLNHLLYSDANCSRLGEDALVFWTDDHKDNFLCRIIKEFFGKDKEEADILPKVKSAIEAFRQGKLPDVSLDKGNFYLAILSANKGRVFVKEFIAEPLKDLAEKVAQHCRDISIECFSQFKGGLFNNTPTLQALARTSLSPKAKKAKPPRTIYKPLVRAILLGEPYPIDLVVSALSLCMRGSDSFDRKSLLKAYLNRIYRQRNEKEVSVSLDKDRKNIGYLIGRFLAVADVIQSRSVGKGLNKSYSDRYRASLGSTPRYVFKDIADRVSAHLSKLKKLIPGMGFNLEKEYSSILENISEIPVILPMEEQVLFVLGYQHQQQNMFKPKSNQPLTEESVHE